MNPMAGFGEVKVSELGYTSLLVLMVKRKIRMDFRKAPGTAVLHDFRFFYSDGGVTLKTTGPKRGYWQVKPSFKSFFEFQYIVAL
jgi:hypothetical protein